jgi:hypothetical protein
MEYSKLVKAVKMSTIAELEQIQRWAIGRMLKMGARQEQAGDLLAYERCRWIIIHAAEEIEKRKTEGE